MGNIYFRLCVGVSAAAMVAPAYGQTGQVIDETPATGTELPTSEPEGDDRRDDTGRLTPANEIIVSARRREESLQDVPQTVNVVTAAQVEKLNLRNFQEIQNIVPGLTMSQTSAFSSQATVRGVAFVPEASGNNPSVEFYLNDAPISSTFLFQSTFDFGQFELQRGPQGTLRGRAAPSGSISVTARRPDLDEVGAVFHGTIADPRARKIDGAFNLPIIRDVLGVRLAGVIDNSRGTRVHSIKEEVFPQFNEGPYRRTKAIRGSVRFEPADWVKLNFMYQSLHSLDHNYTQVVSRSFAPGDGTTPTATVVNGFDFTPVIRPFDRLSLDDVGGYDRQDLDVYIGNVDFRFAGQKLSYVGSYTKSDTGASSPSDAGDQFAPPRVNIVARQFIAPANFANVCGDEARMNGFTPNTGAPFGCTHGFQTRQSHELRLASEERIAGIFDYVIGGFYDHPVSPSDIVGENASFATGNVGSRTGRLRRARITEKSVFGNLTAHLFDDRLELSGGLRYIDYKLRSQLIVANSTVRTDDRVKDTATIYTASAKYKVTDDIMVYALTGTSFRPTNPVVGDFSVGPTGTEGPSPLERAFTLPASEKSTSYEVGAKTSFLDGRGRFNISAYYQKFRNYPFRAPTAVNFINYRLANNVVLEERSTFNFVSPVPVTVKGIEGEASFQILDRWSISGNASFSDGKIKNGTIACNPYFTAAGVPFIPTVAQIRAAAAASGNPGETLAVCTGVNRPVLTTPKFNANVQSEFGFDVTDTTDGFVRGLAVIRGKTQGDIDSPFDQVGAFGLLNLYAGIRDKDGAWEVTIFGKNILRERQVLSIGSTPLNTTIGGNSFVSQYRSVSVTAPRELGLTAKIAFGSR